MAQLLTEKQKDRVADVVIRVGGIVVILAVVAIVVNIGLEALPLFLPAGQGPVVRTELGETPLAAAADARRELWWTLGGDGLITVHGLAAAPLPILDRPLEVVAADLEIGGILSALTADDEVVVGAVAFRDSWDGGERTTSARFRPAAAPLRLTELVPAEATAAAAPWQRATANRDADGNLVAAAWRADGGLAVARWDADDAAWQAVPVAAELDVATAAVAAGLDRMAVVDRSGRTRLVDLATLAATAVDGLDQPVAAVRFLIGGGTLVAAEVDGDIQVVLTIPRIAIANRGLAPLAVGSHRVLPGATLVVPDDEIGRGLASRTDVTLSAAPAAARVVRTLPRLSGRPTVIAPAHRDRGFLVGSDDGSVGLYYSTSGRRLLLDRWADRPVTALAADAKGNGATAVAGAALLTRSIANPHPEISLRTLFLPVWYEGYGAPRWVWQSSGGSDDAEPKLSLWPLIFGTLKATFYALALAVPLALMAALYVSQLAPAWIQTTVKPTIELMAAVPSVVVGFVAALWLAPHLELTLLAAALTLLALPLAVAVAVPLWRLVPTRVRVVLPAGADLAFLLAAVALTVTAAWHLAALVEARYFAGDLQRFLFTEWGLRYDQRNSLVVGIALAFAVIPVIFTIAEDACTAVPRSLVTASRALGATRWQTALHLVVPAASPGLFAAVMLGLGRAVGETMIVLMAAGNTPLLDLSPFNGMRTMSAAIAVEIPEAPVGGTLFRVLFLTGTLLFAFTLLVTTAADVVGSHLRKRYARF